MVKLVGNYSLEKVIGQGQYGKVYKGLHVGSKQEYAIKAIKVSKFQEYPKLVECLKNQLDTLALIQDNPYVIKFVDMVKTANNIYLVYEFCEEGTLDQEIRRCRLFPERKALAYFKQLLEAFKSLADKKILHRDIKPDNILLHKGRIKLADFGFCKRMSSLDDLTQTVLGSPIYMAPEVLSGDLYNSKADVWSLGIVLYEMLFGITPFSEGNLAQLVKEMDNFRIHIPFEINPISQATQGLLRRMLEKQHFRRISWEDLLYQYDVNDFGVLTKKEKGFEFDLMKLMKKNGFGGAKSSNGNSLSSAETIASNTNINATTSSSTASESSSSNKTKSLASQFNWDTITDGKSSIRSQDLAVHSILGCDLDKILTVKSKVKQFTSSHTKCLNASLALGELLRGKHSEKHSKPVAYLVCLSIKNSLDTLKDSVSRFQVEHYSQLDASPTQHAQIRKLLMVLADHKKQIVPRLNAIKIALLSPQNEEERVPLEVFHQALEVKVRNKYANLYIDQISKKHQGFGSLDSPLGKDAEENTVKTTLVHVIQVLNALHMQDKKEAVAVSENLSQIKLLQMLHVKKRDLGI